MRFLKISSISARAAAPWRCRKGGGCQKPSVRPPAATLRSLIMLPSGKEDHLPAAQYFGGEKRQQARKIVGHRTAAAQKVGECFVAEEELVRRDAAAIGAGRLVNEILRNDGFEAREVIEQKYLAGLDVAVGVVNLDVDAQAAAQQRECPHAPLIQRLVDPELGIPAHWTNDPSAEAVRQVRLSEDPNLFGSLEAFVLILHFVDGVLLPRPAAYLRHRAARSCSREERGPCRQGSRFPCSTATR